MSDPEDLLRDALRHHADRTPYDATPVGEVETAARGLRRRRLATVVLGAAVAVAALTVPVTLVAGRDAAAPPPGTPATTPATSGPSVTISEPTSDPEPSQGEVGEAPRIAYAEGPRIHEPGGRVFLLPHDLAVSGFAPYRGGYLVADTRNFEGSVGLTRYDADGREVASWATTGGPVSSSDSSLVAWTSYAAPESGTTAPTLVHLGSSTNTDPERTQEIDLDRPSVVGLLGDEVVVQPAFAAGVWVTDLDSSPRRISGLDRATDVSAAQRLVAGSVDDSGVVGRVVDAATGVVVWERRGVIVGSFSPDGRYALTTQTKGGQREIVEALTGAPVAEVEASGDEDFPTLLDLTWEDDSHLLGDLIFNCCTPMARVDLDGRFELATPGGEIGGRGFVFSVTS